MPTLKIKCDLNCTQSEQLCEIVSKPVQASVDVNSSQQLGLKKKIMDRKRLIKTNLI
jgi:hypothetical protein